jgi:hypothetical protein
MGRVATNPGFAPLTALLVVFSCSVAHAQSDEAAALDQRVVELYQAGKTAEAIPLAKKSLELREKALPAGHPDIAKSLNNLAFLYQAQGTPGRMLMPTVWAMRLRSRLRVEEFQVCLSPQPRA